MKIVQSIANTVWRCQQEFPKMQWSASADFYGVLHVNGRKDGLDIPIAVLYPDQNGGIEFLATERPQGLHLFISLDDAINILSRNLKD